MNVKLLEELTPHLLRVNKDMIGQPVLNSQGQTVEKRVVGVSLARIHVVRGERDLLSQHLVVEHQQRPIEDLELVVPQDVQDLRPCGRGVAEESRIVDQHSRHLRRETGTLALIPAQIEKVELGTHAQFGAVQLIAPDEIQTDTPRDERRRQAERVRPVATAGQQTYEWLRIHSVSSRNARIGRAARAFSSAA